MVENAPQFTSSLGVFLHAFFSLQRFWKPCDYYHDHMSGITIPLSTSGYVMIDSLFKPYTHSALKSVNPPFLCFQKWQKYYSKNFDENNCLSFCYTNVVKEKFRPEGVL